MKRNEMIHIMLTASATGPSAENMIRYLENILTQMEAAGMIPPIEPDRRIEDLDLGLPEWEPEEQKELLNEEDSHPIGRSDHSTRSST